MLTGFTPLFWTLIGAGLVISLLSALEKRIRWIASFCALFGEGCKRTAEFTLFSLPVSWWGGLFYVLLALSALVLPRSTGWLIMAGLGFELTFVWIMIAMRAFCIFCLFNAVVVAGLLGFGLDTSHPWAMGTVALLFLLVSSFLLWRENMERIKRVPFLQEPASPEEQLTLAGRPSQGPEDAVVTVVEFSDYLCPACCKAHEIVRRLRKVYEGQVRWIFKDLPLPMHEGARELAAAAHCAGDQDRFWEFQDVLFGAPSRPERRDLLKAAEDLGLDTETFASCLDATHHLDQVDHDAREAQRAGVTATPTFLINGEMHKGVPDFNDFSEMIKAALEKGQARQAEQPSG